MNLYRDSSISSPVKVNSGNINVNQLLFLGFNQDGGCFASGTSTGNYIINLIINNNINSNIILIII